MGDEPDAGDLDGEAEAAESRTADGSNYRDEDRPGSETAEGANYRETEDVGHDVADGRNYREADRPGREIADGSNYRGRSQRPSRADAPADAPDTALERDSELGGRK